MVRDVAPHLIPENGAYDIINGFNGDDDGSIFWRGGNDYYSDADFGAGLRHIWTGHLAAGERILFANSADFGVLNGTTPVNLGSDGRNGPAVCAEIGGLLFIGGGYIYGGSLKAAPYSTGTVSVTNGSTTVTGAGVTWNTLVDAGMLLQLGNGRVYVVESITDSTHLELSEAYEGATAAGQAYTLHNIYKITTADPYVASDTYAVSTARLLWHDERNVYFSSLRTTAPQENPHTFSPTDYHTVPDGARIVGIAAIGQIVLVFTTAGIWRLTGIAYNIVDAATGDPQHSFELLSKDYILVSPAAIAYWEQYLVVPCTDGIYLIDGTSSPVRISKSIDPLWHDYIRFGYKAGGAAVYKGRYFLPILVGSSSVKDVLVCRLDRGARDRRRRVMFPWSRLQGSGAEIAAYAVKNAADPRSPKLLGAEFPDTARVTDCSGYFTPSAANKQDADGTTPDFEIVTRDFPTGGLTLNTVRYARLGYELVADTGDDPRLILDYASGIRRDDAPKWGDPNGEWGVGFGPSGTSGWAATSDGEFSPVMRGSTRDYAYPSILEPHRFRLNKRLRYARLRLRADNGPAELCVIRRIELQIRPSQAVRR